MLVIDYGVEMESPSPPASVAAVGRNWRLESVNVDVAAIGEDVDDMVERVSGVYLEFQPPTRVAEYTDPDTWRPLLAGLIGGTQSLLSLHQNVNYQLRLSLGSNWLGDLGGNPTDVGLIQGTTDWVDGWPLLAYLQSALATARNWPDIVTVLEGMQLALSGDELVDLTDEEKPRQLDGNGLDWIQWSEIVAVEDFSRARIRCYYGLGDEYAQFPIGGDFDHIVDHLAIDWGAASAEILLQRARLTSSRTRATAMLPLPEKDLPVHLYDVIKFRGRYWRVMAMDGGWGESDAQVALTLWFVADVPGEEPDEEE